LPLLRREANSYHRNRGWRRIIGCGLESASQDLRRKFLLTALCRRSLAPERRTRCHPLNRPRRRVSKTPPSTPRLNGPRNSPLRSASRILVRQVGGVRSLLDRRWRAYGSVSSFSDGRLGPAGSLLYTERKEFRRGAVLRVQGHPRTPFRNASILSVADFDRSFGKSVKPCAPPG
jgi:hypothetical protein